MRRSVSRASKISTDGPESSDSSFLGVPEAQWHEFLQKEETDLFILGIRDEIVQKALDICFDNYMERQAVSFTVYCSYMAWCKVLDIYYMLRDPGDTDDPVTKQSWEPDLEPEPSFIDSWGSDCMESTSAKPESKKKDSGEGDSKSESEGPCVSESLDSCSFMSNLFSAEGEGGFLQSFASSSLMSVLSGRKSIFTRTLSTPREDLPVNNPLEGLRSVCKRN